MHRNTKRCYLLVDEEGGPTEWFFRSRVPRGAALRAAARGHEKIGLFDPLNSCIWRFRGWLEALPRGEFSERSWLESGHRLKRPSTEKLGCEPVDGPHAERLEAVLTQLHARWEAERETRAKGVDDG